MTDVIHVKGEGGAIFEMALPLAPAIAQRLTKGYLQRVNADGSPWVEPAGDAAEPTDAAPARPAVNAPKAEWVGFAVRAHGFKPDDAEALTKAELVEMFGKE